MIIRSSLLKFCIFLLVGSFQACDKPIYTNIPVEDLSLLENDEMIVFMDNQGEPDSLLIRKDIFYTVLDKRYYYQSVDIGYYEVANRKIASTYPRLAARQRVENTNVSTQGFFFPALSIGNELSGFYIVGSRQLEQVHKLLLDPALTTSFKASDIVEIYYHVQYGVLQYRRFDGRVFVRTTL
jgi:hypothetical protein